MKKWLIMIIALMPLVGFADQIYRWTDDQGVVHFSSKPVNNGQDHQQISLPESPKAKAEQAEQSEAEKQTDAVEGTEQTTEAVKPAPENIEYCKELRSNIRTLRISPRVKIKRDDGEYEILGDKGRKTEMDRLNKLLEEFC